MYRTHVLSSNVESVGYDEDASILEVAFLSGSVYQYLNVPSFHYRGLLNAPSKGKYLHAHIKQNYRYRRIL